MRVTGHYSMCQLHHEVGQYKQRAPGRDRRWMDWPQQPCPFCAGILRTPDTSEGISRLKTFCGAVTSEGKRLALVDYVPETHQFLKCNDCDAEFTTLRGTLPLTDRSTRAVNADQ